MQRDAPRRVVDKEIPETSLEAWKIPEKVEMDGEQRSSGHSLGCSRLEKSYEALECSWKSARHKAKNNL